MQPAASLQHVELLGSSMAVAATRQLQLDLAVGISKQSMQKHHRNHSLNSKVSCILRPDVLSAAQEAPLHCQSQQGHLMLSS
jgi:hypothetical protein